MRLPQEMKFLYHFCLGFLAFIAQKKRPVLQKRTKRGAARPHVFCGLVRPPFSARGKSSNQLWMRAPPRQSGELPVCTGDGDCNDGINLETSCLGCVVSELQSTWNTAFIDSFLKAEPTLIKGFADNHAVKATFTRVLQTLDVFQR